MSLGAGKEREMVEQQVSARPAKISKRPQDGDGAQRHPGQIEGARLSYEKRHWNE